VSADNKLKDLHSVFAGILNITTNIMTPEGGKIACTWVHTTKKAIGYQGDAIDPTETVCMVSGDSLEEVIRKVAEMEDDFKENGQ
jgi:hypothetical protein